jgi:hypothetical protein
MLIPGLSFVWPGLDSREDVMLFLPVQGTGEYVPTPKKIFVEKSDEGAHTLINEIFQTLHEGRDLKKPGEDFFSSDDLILKKLLSVHIHQIWQIKNIYIIDLDFNSIAQQSSSDIKDFFKCFHLTIENNDIFNSIFLGKKIIYRLDGVPVGKFIQNTTSKKEFIYLNDVLIEIKF